MSPDTETIAFYDRSAEDYAAKFATPAKSESLDGFIGMLSPKSRVLDLGCGPARASAQMRDAGLRPDPVDASVGMVELANRNFDIGARLLTFDEIDMVAAYDGVWANFSLLHAPPEDLPRLMKAIGTALRPSGVFHVALKTGVGVKRDHLSRLYTFVTRDALERLLSDAGFTVTFVKEGEERGCAGTLDPFVVMRAVKNA